MPHYLKVSQTASTNTYLSRLAATLPGGTVIYTPSQTAGRGQKGNSWESEDGKNLTFSMLLKQPPVKARDQFCLSEAAAIAVVEALTTPAGNDFTVKWPNDVYWQDKKICGMLIENSLDGTDIATCIIGIGINVNQVRFVSDAPNPVSLYQLTGQETDRDALLKCFLEAFERVSQCKTSCFDYRERLFKRGKDSLYEDKTSRFTARLMDVLPDGRLLLVDQEGRERLYAFKEVQFVI